jgi:hypothetical protein
MVSRGPKKAALSTAVHTSPMAGDPTGDGVSTLTDGRTVGELLDESGDSHVGVMGGCG